MLLGRGSVKPIPSKTTPPPPHPNTRKKHITTAKNMLYIARMVIIGGHDIKKTSTRNFDF